MTDSVIALITSVVGLFLLLIGFIALAVRSNEQQVVSWKGFGVTFEIKPCARCRARERNTNGS